MASNLLVQGQDIQQHIMALSAPVDADKTTPEETADLMRDFIEK